MASISDEVIPLNEIGKTGTVRVYNQAFVDKQQKRIAGLEERLTEAKELLNEFVEWANWQGRNCPNFKSIQDKAEQFLKEE